MKKIIIPENYDYVGVYITDKCHLRCPYCITRHHDSPFGKQKLKSLTAEQWVSGLNRFVLPEDVPLTFQGGEPFLYQEIGHLLENIEHKVDILTALPPFLKKDYFMNLKTLEWNRRISPYPTIRVSYHKGQNDYNELISRIADLQDILSIGLFYLDSADYEDGDLKELKRYAGKYDVELRKKEFLGEWKGKIHGTFLYPDAVVGKKRGVRVNCKNSVVPIAPDGTIYRCHSDLYFHRRDLAIGNILDEEVIFPTGHLPCDNYGLCSECDVKVKTNHYQQYGYTSVEIKFENEKCETSYKL